MGVYLYGMSGAFKMALINGQRVKVHSWTYMYKDSFSENKADRAKCLRAEARFIQQKPAYAALVFEEKWAASIVYKNPKSGTYADTTGFPAECPIGFLVPQGRGWTVAPRIQLNSSVLVEGQQVAKQEIRQLTDGVMAFDTSYYVGGQWITANAFAELTNNIRNGTAKLPVNKFDPFDL